MHQDETPDDCIVEQEITTALAGELEKIYPSRSQKTSITHAWSGIQCYTSDELPIVGQIKEKPHEYLSVGYNGEGMGRAFTCGRHIAEKIKGGNLTQPLIDQ